jgi:nucleoside-diphosphate-sugar epimerase
MRVLLAGATGVIGTELRSQLLAAGHDVTGLSRTATPRSEVGVDLLDRDATLRAVEGLHFDAVVHQATALRRTPLTAGHMKRTNRLRTEGTSTLLAVARETGARRFVTASGFVGYGFSDHGSQPIEESETFAAQTTTSLDAVQLALLSNEQQVRSAGGTALRYGLVYGTGPSPVVAAGWHGLLPVVHVVDAASAVIAALTRSSTGQAYNIADDVAVSWAELQQASAVAAGRPLPREVAPWLLRASAPFAAELIASTSMRLSTAKAKRELRWRPRYPSFAEGLASQVEVVAPA